jgi:anti-anti-sigma factor
LELSGNFDASQASRLRIEDIQHAAGTRHILINLKQLSFCDSSGIAFFLKLQRAQSLKRLNMVLCNAGPTVQQMLRVTRLERVIPCSGSLWEGRKFLSGDHEQMRSVV